LKAQKLAPHTSNLLMLGFQLKGSLGKRKKLKNIFIEGIIINNTIFYEADINTIIAIGDFLSII
jgi:hypothetical protein